MPTPPCLNRALSPMQSEDSTGRMVEEENLEGRWRRIGRGRVGLRQMPCLEASTNVLEILILRSYHPSELIMPLFDKITMSGMLRRNKCPKGGFLLLN